MHIMIDKNKLIGKWCQIPDGHLWYVIIFNNDNSGILITDSVEQKTEEMFLWKLNEESEEIMFFPTGKDNYLPEFLDFKIFKIKIETKNTRKMKPALFLELKACFDTQEKKYPCTLLQTDGEGLSWEFFRVRINGSNNSMVR